MLEPGGDRVCFFAVEARKFQSVSPPVRRDVTRPESAWREPEVSRHERVVVVAEHTATAVAFAQVAASARAAYARAGVVVPAPVCTAARYPTREQPSRAQMDGFDPGTHVHRRVVEQLRVALRRRLCLRVTERDNSASRGRRGVGCVARRLHALSSALPERRACRPTKRLHVLHCMRMHVRLSKDGRNR